jgi:hypothetical protein
MILVGQNTYEEMVSYWPGAETEPGGLETDREPTYNPPYTDGESV